MLRLMYLESRLKYGYVGLHKSTTGFVIMFKVGALDSFLVAIVFPLGPYQIKATIGGLRRLYVSKAAYYVSLIR